MKVWSHQQVYEKERIKKAQLEERQYVYIVFNSHHFQKKEI